MNLSIIDEKLTTLEADRSHLLKELIEVINNSGLDTVDLAELEFSEQAKSSTLEKLRQVLACCSEEKRQMQFLVSKNAELQSDNQQLNDANYDLRYELQEVRRGADPRAI